MRCCELYSLRLLSFKAADLVLKKTRFCLVSYYIVYYIVLFFSFDGFTLSLFYLTLSRRSGSLVLLAEPVKPCLTVLKKFLPSNAFICGRKYPADGRCWRTALGYFERGVSFLRISSPPFLPSEWISIDLMRWQH